MTKLINGKYFGFIENPELEIRLIDKTKQIYKVKPKYSFDEALKIKYDKEGGKE